MVTHYQWLLLCSGNKKLEWTAGLITHQTAME